MPYHAGLKEQEGGKNQGAVSPDQEAGGVGRLMRLETTRLSGTASGWWWASWVACGGCPDRTPPLNRVGHPWTPHCPSARPGHGGRRRTRRSSERWTTTTSTSRGGCGSGTLIMRATRWWRGRTGSWCGRGNSCHPRKERRKSRGGKTAPALPSSEDKARTKGLSHLSHPTPSRSKPGGTVG